MIFLTVLKFFVRSDHEIPDMSSTEILNLVDKRSSSTKSCHDFPDRLVYAAILLNCAVILLIVFETGIMLIIDKKQSVKIPASQ